MLLDSNSKSSSIEYYWAIINELIESSELAEMNLKNLNEFLPNLLSIQESSKDGVRKFQVHGFVPGD